ncbi:MAG: hypothetical protein M3Z31_13575 [Pseudomonadota bacterium]|nr:hypothetical protein [Pseudomonadota bacterium]
MTSVKTAHDAKPSELHPSEHYAYARGRFEDLWRRCLPEARDGAGEVRSALLELYGQPMRYFHDLGHIVDCLGHLDEVRELVTDADALELALWFHDAVYVPGSDDNERHSAQMFLAAAGSVAGPLAMRISRLIMATRHTGKVQPGDRAFIVDIDLAGFAIPWEDFMRRGDDLRREYQMQTDDQYYSGQVAFLTRLLRRPHFYCTAFFRERYGATARANLRRLLELRLQQGYSPV